MSEMWLLAWLACTDEPAEEGWTADATWTELDVGTATAIAKVQAAGDVDGDGQTDLLARVRGPDGTRLLVFRGGADLDTSPAYELALDLSSSTDEVLTPGDLDADGFADVVACTGGRGFTMEVYRGSAAGLEATPAWTISPPEWAEDEQTEGFAAVGDVDASGLPHVLVEQDGYLIPYEGAETEPEAHLSNHDQAVSWEVSDAGDLDGDGFDDILAVEDGSPRVYWGNPRGLELHIAGDLDYDVDSRGVDVSWIWPVGDIDGDGFPDSAMMARSATDSGGYLVYGGAESPSALGWIDRTWGSVDESPVIGRAGDQDGDGYDDVLVATPYADDEQGGLALFAGGPDRPPATPVGWLPGGEFGVRLGGAFASGLDLDADGSPDVIASAIDPADGTVQLRFYSSPWGP